MGPHCVEVPTPGLDDHASLCERVEDLTVEKLIAQPCIEALDEPILPRTAWSDVRGLGADRGDPILHRRRNKLGPVVRTNMFGHAARDEEIRQHIDDKEGFRTPEIALPFKALAGFLGDEREMARPKRFELLTPRFEVWCSIQLSYGRRATYRPCLPPMIMRRKSCHQGRRDQLPIPEGWRKIRNS